VSYNLIDKPWIPVRRRSGATDWIAPWQITETDDPPMFVDSARPDFDAALTEFLIGLLQTTIGPEDTRAWRKLYRHPPAPSELEDAFLDVRDAFDLFGSGARFLQDASVRDESDGHPVEGLLIGQPGAHTRIQNTDHFVHAGQIQALCEACGAAAIYALQAFGPAGGAGYRVSLRGGGPLSVTVLDSNLASTTIANLLVGRARPERQELVFPWLAPLRTSKQGEVTTPEDAHPLQAFWGQPNRVFVTPDGVGRCDCCGRASTQTIRRFWKEPHGVNYEGAWIHPLTPYRLTKEGVPISIKGTPRRVPYSLWLDFLVPTDTTRPPQNILALQQEQRNEGTARIRACGFDMDNMKARGWCSEEFPVFHLEPPRLDEFASVLRQLVELASGHEKALILGVQKAIKRLKSEAKASSSPIESLRLAFWARTESVFFDIAATLAESSASEVECKEAWLRATEDACLEVFRSRVDLSALLDTRNVDRATSAYVTLRRAVSATGEKNRKKLNLAPRRKEKNENATSS